MILTTLYMVVFISASAASGTSTNDYDGTRIESVLASSNMNGENRRLKKYTVTTQVRTDASRDDVKKQVAAMHRALQPTEVYMMAPASAPDMEIVQQPLLVVSPPASDVFLMEPIPESVASVQAIPRSTMSVGAQSRFESQNVGKASSFMAPGSTTVSSTNENVVKSTTVTKSSLNSKLANPVKTSSAMGGSDMDSETEIDISSKNMRSNEMSSQGASQSAISSKSSSMGSKYMSSSQIASTSAAASSKFNEMGSSSKVALDSNSLMSSKSTSSNTGPTAPSSSLRSGESSSKLPPSSYPVGSSYPDTRQVNAQLVVGSANSVIGSARSVVREGTTVGTTNLLRKSSTTSSAKGKRKFTVNITVRTRNTSSGSSPANSGSASKDQTFHQSFYA